MIEQQTSSRLVPHPWDAIADRIVPGAQTADEAADLKFRTEITALTREVRDHRDEARYLVDRIEDENSDGDDARERLVALIGEDAARKELGEDAWEGPTWV